MIVLYILLALGALWLIFLFGPAAVAYKTVFSRRATPERNRMEWFRAAAHGFHERRRG